MSEPEEAAMQGFGSRINLGFGFFALAFLHLAGWIGAVTPPHLSANECYRTCKFKKHSISDELTPFLMKKHHPIKSRLDALFSSDRVTLNMKTLTKAGFIKAKPRKFTKLIVTRHPSFPGYIFKLYLDAQRPHKNLPEHEFWKMRVEGANKIRTYLVQYRLESTFKVPSKWIYRLPSHPLPPEGYYQRQSLLVEEDMEILSDRKNKQEWASESVTHALLDSLYLILKDLGLRDCAKPDNIPFSKDGRIAFIDTQTHCSNTVHFFKLNNFLSPVNKKYWKSLTQ